MKSVKLHIRSLRNGSETSDLSTVASMVKKDSTYSFIFDSPDERIFAAKRLRLTISGNGICLCADGISKLADIVLEKGKKHYCYFCGNDGNENTEVGIDTYFFKSDMTDDGGDVEIEYYMDRNCSDVSRNKMQISVRPNG